jgi:hypothetical protein
MSTEVFSLDIEYEEADGTCALTINGDHFWDDYADITDAFSDALVIARNNGVETISVNL